MNKSIRGISAFGNIDINGNVELVINGGPSSVIGVGAWKGAQLRFSGDSTKIIIRSSLPQSGFVYGVQGSNANTVISFNANNSSIVVDNSSENTSNSYGVSTTSSLINFSGNSNIFVYGNFGETYGVNVQNSSNNGASIILAGSETKIKVSGGNRVFGVRSSGSQSEINFTGNEASVEVKSERGQAYGLIIENGGYVNFAGNIATIEAESNTNSAYGVSSESGSHANFAGNAEILTRPSFS